MIVVACPAVSFGSKLSVTPNVAVDESDALPAVTRSVASVGPTEVPDRTSNESACCAPKGTLGTFQVRVAPLTAGSPNAPAEPGT